MRNKEANMSNFVKSHFSNLEGLLKAQSKMCQPNLPSYDIGINREFFVREVLQNHLPSNCEISSGCICDNENKPSGQVDIILFHPLTFRVNIGTTDCCLSESVFCAIEIKSRLSEKDFDAAVKNFVFIDKLSRENLCTDMRGATSDDQAYHFNTIGTIIFAYRGYTSKTCVKKLSKLPADIVPRI